MNRKEAEAVAKFVRRTLAVNHTGELHDTIEDDLVQDGLDAVLFPNGKKSYTIPHQVQGRFVHEGLHNLPKEWHLKRREIRWLNQGLHTSTSVVHDLKTPLGRKVCTLRNEADANHVVEALNGSLALGKAHVAALRQMADAKERAERLEAVVKDMQTEINTGETTNEGLVAANRQLRRQLNGSNTAVAQLSELYNVLDEVRTYGCEPVVMLKELVRSYRAKGGELAEMQRRVDAARADAEIAQTVGLRHASVNLALKEKLKTIADGLESKPGYFPLDAHGLAFYVAQLREMLK